MKSMDGFKALWPQLENMSWQSRLPNFFSNDKASSPTVQGSWEAPRHLGRDYQAYPTGGPPQDTDVAAEELQLSGRR